MTPIPPPSMIGRRALGALALGTAAIMMSERGSAAAPIATATLPKNTTPAWHLARRACIAPTAAIAAQIEARGTSQWVEDQLNPGAIGDARVEGIIGRHYSVVNAETGAQVRSHTNDKPWEAAPALVRALILRQVYGERHLLESMTEFWSDQIYVAAQGKSESYVAHYNHTVLRRHALGKFSDLLLASVRHPAVLVYLDNDANSKDNSNENLGRELLELHTVGVGNYTEDDVRQCALLLTGHTFDWKSLGYRYAAWDHHVGPLRIMGFSDANGDAANGESLLARFTVYLATHPATARRLATRLCRRFVSDTPPAALVDRLAATYLRNGTDIKPVLRELFASREFADSVGQKWRRLQEALNGMWRALSPGDYVPNTDPRTNPWGTLWNQLTPLTACAQPPRGWPYVDGFPDTASAWQTTNIMLATWNAAHLILDNWGNQWQLRPLEQLFPVPVGARLYDALRGLTFELTGWHWAEADIAVLASMAQSWGQRPADPAAVITEDMRPALQHVVRLVLGSPYFQMR